MSREFKLTLIVLLFLSLAYLYVAGPRIDELNTFSFFIIHTYVTEPGNGTQGQLEDFYKNRKTCRGLSILLNKKAVEVDAPGVSLCLGILK